MKLQLPRQHGTKSTSFANAEFDPDFEAKGFLSTTIDAL